MSILGNQQNDWKSQTILHKMLTSSRYQAGEELILSDCSAKITCEGLNVTKPEPEVCGANEECKKEDGAASCHCKEGFVKADDDSCQGRLQ